MTPVIDQIVAIIALLTFGGLVLALYVSERRWANLRNKAEKDSQEAMRQEFEKNQAQLDEVLNNVDKRRQEDLDNLNHLKHAVWSDSYGQRREWRPGDHWPQR